MLQIQTPSSFQVGMYGSVFLKEGILIPVLDAFLPVWVRKILPQVVFVPLVGKGTQGIVVGFVLGKFPNHGIRYFQLIHGITLSIGKIKGPTEVQREFCESIMIRTQFLVRLETPGNPKVQHKGKDTVGMLGVLQKGVLIVFYVPDSGV